MKVLIALHVLQHLILFVFNSFQCNEYEIVSHCDFHFYFPDHQRGWISPTSLKFLYLLIAHIFTGLFSLYAVGTSFVVGYMFCKYCFQVYGLSFYFMVFFDEQKLLTLIQLDPFSCIVFKSFRVLPLKFKTLIPILIHHMRKGSSFFLFFPHMEN